MRIKINKSGNDIKKTCGSIFFQADPPSCLHYRPSPPATTPLPCAPFHFILATHAKCVACFRGDAARYPFTVAQPLSKACKALLICIEGRHHPPLTISQAAPDPKIQLSNMLLKASARQILIKYTTISH